MGNNTRYIVGHNMRNIFKEETGIWHVVTCNHSS